MRTHTHETDSKHLENLGAYPSDLGPAIPAAVPSLLYNSAVKVSAQSPAACTYCSKPLVFKNPVVHRVKENLLVDPSEINYYVEKPTCAQCHQEVFIDLRTQLQQTHLRTKTQKEKDSGVNKKSTPLYQGDFDSAKIQKNKLDFLLFLLNVFAVAVKEEFYEQYDLAREYNPLMDSPEYRHQMKSNYLDVVKGLFQQHISILAVEDARLTTPEPKDAVNAYGQQIRMQIELMKMLNLYNILGYTIPIHVSQDLNYTTYFLPKLKLYYNFRDYIGTKGVTFENIDLDYYKQYANFLFLDLDGTLKDENGISFEVLNYLRDLESKKILKVIFCSGRPATSLMFLQKDLGLKDTSIGRNGAEVVYYRTNKELSGALRLAYENPLVAENLKKVSCLRYLVHQRERSTVLFRILEILRKKHRLPVKLFINQSILDILTPLSYEDLIEQIDLCILKDPELKMLIESINGLILTPVTTVNGNIFTVAQGSSTKGQATQRFIDACGIDKESTFNIGNSFNDISLTFAVGRSYAVSSAEPEYIKHVTYVAKAAGLKDSLTQCIDDFFKNRSSSK